MTSPIACQEILHRGKVEALFNLNEINRGVANIYSEGLDVCETISNVVYLNTYNMISRMRTVPKSIFNIKKKFVMAHSPLFKIVIGLFELHCCAVEAHTDSMNIVRPIVLSVHPLSNLIDSEMAQEATVLDRFLDISAVKVLSRRLMLHGSEI